jgi:hypothetical protein
MLQLPTRARILCTFCVTAVLFVCPIRASAYDPGQMISIAAQLAADTKDYGPTGSPPHELTHCNQFVAAWFRDLTGAPSPDLADLASQDVDNMAHDTAHWLEITNQSDWSATYHTATSLTQADRVPRSGV